MKINYNIWSNNTMTKRELDRIHKRIENHIKNMKKSYIDPIEFDNKERIDCFKYYNGYDYKAKRVVRSITLSYVNDDFIKQIQQAAKQENSFISKDIVINIALYHLAEDMEEKGVLGYNSFLRTYLK